MALPANITAGSDSNVLTIAASNNKGLLIRFLNEQVEDGFYALVIDYLKDSNFDLKNMMVEVNTRTGKQNRFFLCNALFNAELTIVLILEEYSLRLSDAHLVEEYRQFLQ